MKVVIFGASGKSGLKVVAEALDKEHTVIAYVRNEKTIALSHPRLSVAVGELSDFDKISEVIKDSDAVVLAVGFRPGNKQPVCSLLTNNVLDAMKVSGVKDLIAITAYGIDSSNHPLSLGSRFVLWLMTSLYTAALTTEDKLRQESLIEKSGLNWTIIQPPRLIDGDTTGAYKVEETFKMTLSDKIRRSDIAEFIISHLGKSEYHGKKLALRNV